MSLKDNYLKCVDSVSYFERELIDVEKTSLDGRNDLIWYCTELQKTVVPDDVDHFENLTGLKTVRQNIEKALSSKSLDTSLAPTSEKMTSSGPIVEKWAKDMYRRAVRRCHPDIHKKNDDDYSDNLVEVFNTISEAHNSLDYSKLMVGCSRVFVYPKVIKQEQITILQNKSQSLKSRIEAAKKSEGYVWINLPPEQRETFLTNYLKQMGIRFQDKTVVKEVIKRKRPPRRTGTRPPSFKNVKLKN